MRLFSSIAQHGRRLLHCMADIVGKLWAAPYSVLGLGYGCVAHVISRLVGTPARIRLGNNAIEFINIRGIIPGAALTLGNVILYGPGASPWRCGAYGDARVNLGRHEQAHTYQYQVLGPLFIPMYLLCGGCTGPARNPFERAAQNFSLDSGSWWPWLASPRESCPTHSSQTNR